MKTRRKTNEIEEKHQEDKSMAPRPEDSPVSTPRTRSPVKGVRTGGVSCAGPEALSMLNMLAEVASVTLHTDPSVTDTSPASKSKASNAASRKPSDYDLLTLEHVASMTDNLLVKLFAEFESNEMWRRFTYTCGMLPAACSKYFQSFGSEHKARAGMKSHLQVHLKSLMEIHKSVQSRQSYVLESVPARNRRLALQESSGSRRRNSSMSSRGNKGIGSPRTHSRVGDNPNKIKKATPVTPEKENEFLKQKDGLGESKERKTGSLIPNTDGAQVAGVKKATQEIRNSESKPKRRLESTREGRIRTKKMKSIDTASPVASSDINDNNNNNSDVKIEIKEENPRITSPPIQQVVSHDHGYLKATPYVKYEPAEQGETGLSEIISSEGPQMHLGLNSSQILWDAGGDNADEGSIGGFYIKETPSEDHTTLLHQHMNQELQGGIMAQDCGSAGTPLPVVGCEIEFTPDQQYKIMRSADLPVVYDQNNPSANVQTVSKIIERDEYKVRKKPKGRAKFIGQSKAEKEMALKLITEIRSQSVMALDTLECKICHPPRLFTAPSTLLSHYRSHAGIRPYECRICEAVFTRQHSLNYHMLIHTNQTRFTCLDCDRKFRHPSHFKEHRRRHTGESPYECSDCLMRFKTRNTYKRHLRTRHGKLLTTQGAIIILSQEEADRMKKTQGRKPRRPRQPLKIISPEAAAQMEEEQIWTDFEEGDREEEEEDEDDEEEEEEEGSHTEESVLSSEHRSVGGCHVPSNTLVTALGVQQITNDKMGLLVRSNKLSLGKNPSRPNHSERVNDWEDPVDSKEIPLDESTYLGGRVEEEVVTEEVAVDDLRTYVFHPPPEHQSLPKVNIRSSWNTINIDLKSLEKATEPVFTETTGNIGDHDEGAKVDQIIGQETEVMTQMVDSRTEFVGDHISPEEVITICAGMESSSEDAAISSVTRQQCIGSESKPDWFTVKKPLKCYGRPAYSVMEPSANVWPEAATVTTSAQPNSHVDAISGHGVYVVEYVQGRDGRLAKVYHASASLVSRNNQQSTQTPTTASASNFVSSSIGRGTMLPVTPITSVAARSVSSINAVTTSVNNSNLMVRGAAREDVKLQAMGNSVAVTNTATFVPTKVISRTDGGSYSKNDMVVINKQVVNNVVVNNHIVKNGSLVSVSCGKHRGTTVTSQLSPPVVVTSVPCITESQNVSDSQEWLPWSSQTLAENNQVSAVYVSSNMEEMKTDKGIVVNSSKNQLGYPLVSQEVEQLVTMKNEFLLENVEIIDSLDVGDNVISVKGTVEDDESEQQGHQDVCVTEPQVHPQKSVGPSPTINSKVKVEELRPNEPAVIDTTSGYVGQLHQHVTKSVYNESDVSPPTDHTSTTPSHALLPSQSLTHHIHTIHSMNTVEAMPPSNLLAATLQI